MTFENIVAKGEIAINELYSTAMLCRDFPDYCLDIFPNLSAADLLYVEKVLLKHTTLKMSYHANLWLKVVKRLNAFHLGVQIAWENSYISIIFTGIIRSPNCTWVDAWTAYKCYEYNYEMLIIESMDSDTETRRLSPVAILGEGYLDLINGPQDHGWCSGYTCRKRVSTFMALVATGNRQSLVLS